jgi:hypothetical protein
MYSFSIRKRIRNSDAFTKLDSTHRNPRQRIRSPAHEKAIAGPKHLFPVRNETLQEPNAVSARLYHGLRAPRVSKQRVCATMQAVIHRCPFVFHTNPRGQHDNHMMKASLHTSRGALQASNDDVHGSDDHRPRCAAHAQDPSGNFPKSPRDLSRLNRGDPMFFHTLHRKESRVVHFHLTL